MPCRWLIAFALALLTVPAVTATETVDIFGDIPARSDCARKKPGDARRRPCDKTVSVFEAASAPPPAETRVEEPPDGDRGGSAGAGSVSSFERLQSAVARAASEGQLPPWKRDNAAPGPDAGCPSAASPEPLPSFLTENWQLQLRMMITIPPFWRYRAMPLWSVNAMTIIAMRRAELEAHRRFWTNNESVQGSPEAEALEAEIITLDALYQDAARWAQMSLENPGRYQPGLIPSTDFGVIAAFDTVVKGAFEREERLERLEAALYERVLGEREPMPSQWWLDMEKEIGRVCSQLMEQATDYATALTSKYEWRRRLGQAHFQAAMEAWSRCSSVQSVAMRGFVLTTASPDAGQKVRLARAAEWLQRMRDRILMETVRLVAAGAETVARQVEGEKGDTEAEIRWVRAGFPAGWFGPKGVTIGGYPPGWESEMKLIEIPDFELPGGAGSMSKFNTPRGYWFGNSKTFRSVGRFALARAKDLAQQATALLRWGRALRRVAASDSGAVRLRLRVANLATRSTLLAGTYSSLGREAFGAAAMGWSRYCAAEVEEAIRVSEEEEEEDPSGRIQIVEVTCGMNRLGGFRLEELKIKDGYLRLQIKEALETAARLLGRESPLPELDCGI